MLNCKFIDSCRFKRFFGAENVGDKLGMIDRVGEILRLKAESGALLI